MMTTCSVLCTAPGVPLLQRHVHVQRLFGRGSAPRLAQRCQLHRQQQHTVWTLQAIGSNSLEATPQSGLSPELKEALEKLITENKVVLFMKGTRQFPQCGFSNTCVQILNTLSTPYETVNILEDERLRSGMKEFSQWPTFPQVYINGEFYGGCDIMIESYQSGTLVEELEAALNS